MPINIATGQVYLETLDAEIHGIVSLRWDRYYKTGMAELFSPLMGKDWTNRYLCTLTRWTEGFEFLTPLGAQELISDPNSVVDRGGRAANFGAYLEVFIDKSRLVVQRWNPDSHEVTRYCFAQSTLGVPARLSSIEDVSGFGLDLAWAKDGTLHSVEQRSERRALIFDYSPKRQLLSVRLTTPNHGTHLICRYDYDATGRLAAAYNAADIPDQYFYNSNDNIDMVMAKDGGRSNFRYDDSGRCVRFSGIDNYDEKTFRYLDATSHSEVTNSYGSITRHRFLPSGQITDTWDEVGRHSGKVYDELGRIVQLQTGTNRTTAFEYDALGNRSKIIDALGRITSFEFNENHQPIVTVDARGGRWTRTYSTQSRLTALADPLAAQWRLTHDRSGLLTEISDPKGNKRRFKYVNGIPVEITDWQGNVYLVGLDAFGRIVDETDPNGGVTKTKFDVLGRPVSVRTPDGKTSYATYDVAGNLTSLAKDRTTTKKYLFGPCGRLLKSTDGNGNSLSYAWGSEPGWLKSMTNSNDETLELERDDSGQIVSERSFDGRVLQFKYDENADCVGILKANGESISFRRSLLGKIERQDCSNGAWAEFYYDEFGRLVRASNETGVIELERDAIGRVTREAFGENSIQHRHDMLGNIVCIESSLGPEISFDLDSNSLWKSIAVDGINTVKFGRDLLGLETQRELPGKIRLSQCFDNVGRLTNQQLISEKAPRDPLTQYGSRGEVLVERTYGRNAYAHITDVIDSHWGATHYEYDEAGSLLEASLQSGPSESFERDNAGNVTNYRYSGDTSSATKYQYDSGNRLRGHQKEALRYDADGRLICKVVNPGTAQAATWTYSWNVLDQLTQIETPAGDIWHYMYDAIGRRTEKRGPASATRFVWNGFRIAHEIDLIDSRVTSWIYDQFNFSPLMTIQGGKIFSVVCDQIGTPREVIDSAGRVVSRYRYLAYGRRLSVSDSTVRMPIRFQGQYADDESGLHYNVFRYFDPAVGRYIQQDFVRPFGGENFYTYSTNPISKVDPFGLNEVCLLNADKAVIDPRKLTEYALNPDHPVGGNKARVFEAALGFNKSNAGELMSQIQEGVKTAPATPGKADEFGQRFTVQVPVTGPSGPGTVTTGWIYKPGSTTPELTTLFVK